jgi:hypothetical protein
MRDWQRIKGSYIQKDSDGFYVVCCELKWVCVRFSNYHMLLEDFLAEVRDLGEDGYEKCWA